MPGWCWLLVTLAGVAGVAGVLIGDVTCAWRHRFGPFADDELTGRSR